MFPVVQTVFTFCRLSQDNNKVINIGKGHGINPELLRLLSSRDVCVALSWVAELASVCESSE